MLVVAVDSIKILDSVADPVSELTSKPLVSVTDGSMVKDPDTVD